MILISSGAAYLTERKEKKSTYSPILQLLLRRRDLLPRQPSPPRQSPPGGMEHAEIIAIADARHVSQEAPPAEVPRRDVHRLGEAAQEAAVDVHDEQDPARQENGGDEVSGLCELGPVGGIEDGVPVGVFAFVGECGDSRSRGG